MARKVVATLAILIGSVEALLQVAVAFGLNITADQHTAIAAFTGVLTACLGVWLHPDIPIGNVKPAEPAGPDA